MEGPLMPEYQWKRTWQGKVELKTTHSTEPPDKSGRWQRVYSVGIGQVPGAGGSPARPAKGKDV